MRRITRTALPMRAKTYLATRHLQVERDITSATFNIEIEWASARKTQSISGDKNSVLATLRKMAGLTERCMYCSDSHGCEIEHFRPKQKYPLYAFYWENMLLVCGECNRHKGNQFPLNSKSQPAIIDPAIDNPWDHLDFDPETGLLTPLFKENTPNNESIKGRQTLDILRFSHREVLGRVYKRCFRKISELVIIFLEAHTITAPNLADIGGLFEQISDIDEQGLLPWCWGSSGKEHSPFTELHTCHPVVWNALAERIHPAP